MNEIIDMIDARILELAKAENTDETVYRMEELIALKGKIVDLMK